MMPVLSARLRGLKERLKKIVRVQWIIPADNLVEVRDGNSRNRSALQYAVNLAQAKLCMLGIQVL
jgi:hypothetical protein